MSRGGGGYCRGLRRDHNRLRHAADFERQPAQRETCGRQNHVSFLLDRPESRRLDTDGVRARLESSKEIIAALVRRPRALFVVQIELPRAVTERLQIVQAEAVQQRQHHVRHRRAIGRLHVQIALEVAVGAAGQEQRAALVIVDVRVAHWRAVDDEAPVEQVAVAIRRVLQLLEEIRHQADVVLVDLRELRDAVLAIAVMRGRMERRVHAAQRVDAGRAVASELE